MFDWNFDTEKNRIKIVVAGRYSDADLIKLVVEVLDCANFGPGVDVLVDASKSPVSLSAGQLSQLIKLLKKSKKRLESCRYAVVVGSSSGLIMANILSALASLVSARAKGFVNLKTAEEWLLDE